MTSTVYFCSDYHLNHRKIIDQQERGFNNVEEMNSAVIDSHNKIVTDNDIVYHVGDLAYACASQKALKEINESLNGRKIYLLGNHDDIRVLKPGISKIIIYLGKPGSPIREKHKVVVTHTPIEAFKTIDKDEADFGICGHVHRNWLAKKDRSGKVVINVSWDTWRQPVTTNEIFTILNHMNENDVNILSYQEVGNFRKVKNAKQNNL